MPTGYTADLHDGKEISFEEFMLKCSRGMGAAILLRDHDSDVLPTEENVVEGDYEERELGETLVERMRVEKLTEGEAVKRRDAEHDKAIRFRADYLAEIEARKERYEEMLARVEAWEPPTSEHEPFKEFVLEQLKGSIEFDCRGYEPHVPPPMTAEAWRSEKLAELDKRIDSLKTRIAEKAERNVQRQHWIRKLRESLEGVPA